MRVLVFLIILAAAASAQNGAANNANANLPAQPIGPNDLLSIAVYDAPELSRTVRVSAEGFIRMPMLKQLVKAEGVYPADLEGAIAQALEQEELLVDPFVTVNIAEYHSRPIVVGGAVKSPTTFQAEGPTTLLEALSKAQGLTDNAGPDILVTTAQAGPDGKQVALVRRIPIQGLIDNADPSLNIVLNGGEEIRVPEAPKIYVVGNVKMPNAYKVQNGSETTVMQILALAQGLAPFAGKTAYIYRPDGNGKKNEIAVPLDKIMQRKSPDVPLMANDIFYVPDRKGKRMTVSALEKIAGVGGSAAAALIYTLRY